MIKEKYVAKLSTSAFGSLVHDKKRVSCFGHPSLSSLPALKRSSHEEPVANQSLFSVLVILWLSLFKDRSPSLGQVWQRRGKKEKGWGVKIGQIVSCCEWHEILKAHIKNQFGTVHTNNFNSFEVLHLFSVISYLLHWISRLGRKLHLRIVITGYFHDFLFPFL